jgi:hypothetical protein
MNNTRSRYVPTTEKRKKVLLVRCVHLGMRESVNAEMPERYTVDADNHTTCTQYVILLDY